MENINNSRSAGKVARSAAFTVSWVMAATGVALAMAAAAVSVDAIILWIGNATGIDLLVRGYMLLQWMWGSIVKGIAFNFGGAEIARAAAFWISSSFAIFVGWWTFLKVRHPVMAYFAIRMRMGDLGDLGDVKKHAVDIRTIDA
ncbi:MAG: hypothetical protein VR70_10725 [Rhodospirillaceae bacterium BRH_c57]|nr:MAG: hypothetical protein VR70_10725 [Rhodospirillaceae bacterium BRH_c57]